MRKLAMFAMTVFMLVVTVAGGIALMHADARAQAVPDIGAGYPSTACTSLGTFPAPRYKTQVYAAPGFVFCHVFVVDPGGEWQFSEDGCRLDGFGRKRCVQGLGTNHLWVLTDGTFLLKTISPFVWTQTRLPLVAWGYP